MLCYPTVNDIKTNLKTSEAALNDSWHLPQNTSSQIILTDPWLEGNYGISTPLRRRNQALKSCSPNALIIYSAFHLIRLS